VQTVEGVRNAEDGKAKGLETHRVECRRLMPRRGKSQPQGKVPLAEWQGRTWNGRTLKRRSLREDEAAYESERRTVSGDAARSVGNDGFDAAVGTE